MSRTARGGHAALGHPAWMEEHLRCPRCARVAWVRGNAVVVAGADGPLRIATAGTRGPAPWTCANCGYEVEAEGVLGARLARIPEHGAAPHAGLVPGRDDA